MEDRLIFNAVKEYPDMLKFTIYNEPLVLKSNSGRKRRVCAYSAKVSARSIHRTRAVVRDICLCNKFEMFCTFTFDPKKYNSHNILACRRYMVNWLHNAKKRHSPCLDYIVIPELHKSGAIHFHALFRGYRGKLMESGVYQHDRMVYNIMNWRFGFSTCCIIDNHEAVSRYVSKYITKDMITFGGKKRYFCSQGLGRPARSHNIDLSSLRQIQPLFRGKIMEGAVIDKDAEYITISKKVLDDFNIRLLQ